MLSLLFGAGVFRPQRRSVIFTQQHINDVIPSTCFYELTVKEITWSCYNVYWKTQIYIFMVLFSLLIAANSKSLFVYCLFVRIVGLLVSMLCIMTISMANLCSILALNCRSREEHCLNRCPFDLHFGYHNFLTTISTRLVKEVFEKSLNCSFFSLAAAYRLYLCIPF